MSLNTKRNKFTSDQIKQKQQNHNIRKISFVDEYFFDQIGKGILNFF